MVHHRRLINAVGGDAWREHDVHRAIGHDRAGDEDAAGQRTRAGPVHGDDMVTGARCEHIVDRGALMDCTCSRRDRARARTAGTDGDGVSRRHHVGKYPQHRVLARAGHIVRGTCEIEVGAVARALVPAGIAGRSIGTDCNEWRGNGGILDDFLEHPVDQPRAAIG